MSSEIEFDEDKVNYGPRPHFVGANSSGNAGDTGPTGNEPRMVQWLMKHGFAASPHAAQGVLVIVVIVNIAIMYFVLSYLL